MSWSKSQRRRFLRRVPKDDSGITAEETYIVEYTVEVLAYWLGEERALALLRRAKRRAKLDGRFIVPSWVEVMLYAGNGASLTKSAWQLMSNDVEAQRAIVTTYNLATQNESTPMQALMAVRALIKSRWPAALYCERLDNTYGR